MNTEITDNNAGRSVGWIYFDAECPLCVAHRRRWGCVLERRGFIWLPLQTPGAAQRLEITEAQLHAEMWLRFADGRKLSGVNAWSALLRRVWWLWPVGVVLAVPGFNALGAALYRWVAKHRHCIGGVCTVPGRNSLHGSNRRGTA